VSGLRESVAIVAFDDQFAAAARALARRIAQARPGPRGGDWTPDDLDDLVCDTIVRVTPDKLVLIANEAVNERQFRTYFAKAIRTTLDGRARKTPKGRVIRAMDDALRQSPEQFTLRAGCWGLTSDDRDPSWSEGPLELIQRAQTVAAATIRIDTAGDRSPPMAQRRDIRAVATEVLSLSGPLPKALLAEVLAYRFNVIFENRLGYLDEDPERPHDPETRDVEAVEDLAPDRVAAEAMLAQLTQDERVALHVYLGGSGVRGLAQALQCTKYRAEVNLERITEKLALLAQEVGDENESATALLLEMCRTSGGSAALGEDEEPS
jgi:hypothetical protein